MIGALRIEERALRKEHGRQKNEDGSHITEDTTLRKEYLGKRTEDSTPRTEN